jgi:SCF-associated factor 1
MLASCGRMHSAALDASNKIWTFTSWGRPFRMTCPVFDDPEFAPVQVECGWMFSCVLVKSGDVFAWWPFSGTLEHQIQRANQQMNKNSNKLARGVNSVIPCVPWDTDLIPERLPPLPSLPELEEIDTEPRKKTMLVKIAGFDGHIVGLTNKGHVLKFRGLENEQTIAQGRWTYVSFSRVNGTNSYITHSCPSSAKPGPFKSTQYLLILRVT